MITAKLIRRGQSQVVNLPKEFRLPGKEAYIKTAGSAVVLLPIEHAWDSLIGSLKKFSDDFMSDRCQPGSPKRKK